MITKRKIQEFKKKKEKKKKKKKKVLERINEINILTKKI